MVAHRSFGEMCNELILERSGRSFIHACTADRMHSMRLPNADRAFIDEQQLLAYCLNTQHPRASTRHGCSRQRWDSRGSTVNTFAMPYWKLRRGRKQHSQAPMSMVVVMCWTSSRVPRARLRCARAGSFDLTKLIPASRPVTFEDEVTPHRYPQHAGRRCAHRGCAGA